MFEIIDSVIDMSSRVQVRVESGVLEGKICKNEFDSGKKYCSFQGIPYARPPIGDLRFKAPLPVEPWKGVRNATKDGDQCYSQHFMNKKLRLGSEDCLNLNIYTPKLPIKNSNNVSFDLKPVMVFIYGGALKFGSNSKMIYGPEFLLREDVILVVINYRTGFLGFLNLEDSSLRVPGNAGFKDMVLALNWVKNNIKNFNGDPNNVTIFGESAGAGCVHLLMLSPLSKGLFHRAIAQSGCAINLWMPCCRLQPVLAAKLGIDIDDGKKLLQTLQSMSVEELHAFQESFPDGTDANKVRVFGYTIENPVGNDQPFLTRDPIELMEKGDYNHVPFMLGFNSGEGMIIRVASETSIPEIWSHIVEYIPHDLNIATGNHLFRIVAEKIMRFYFKDPKFDDIDSIYKFFGDNLFTREIHRAAMKHSKSNIEKCFFYEMVLETSINFYKNNSKIKCRGVCHADDLYYLFKTPMHIDIKPNSPEDKGIRRFCRLWANFAKYGNPNSPVQDNLLSVVWEPFTVEEENYLEIGEELLAKKNPAHDRMKFWNEIYTYINVKHKL